MKMIPSMGKKASFTRSFHVFMVLLIFLNSIGMPTLNQIDRLPRRPKYRPSTVPGLNKGPQRKGICRQVFTRTPKKPNSALRKVTRIGFRGGLNVTAHIPGETHNLQQHSVVLVRGGRVKDLPGVRYKVIRGKLDSHGLIKRRQSRSKYGTKFIYTTKKV
jgi:small subunit ribosomal protein S12